MKTGLVTLFQGRNALQAAALAQAAGDLGADCCLPVSFPAGQRESPETAFLRQYIAFSDPSSKEYGSLLFAGAFGEAAPDPIPDGADCRRAAYALFPGDAFSPEILAGFSHVSFQTEADRTLYQTLTGREASLALDPLLLSEKERWERMSSGSGTPCVLWDCGRESGVLAPYFRRLTAETGLPAIRFGGRPSLFSQVKQVRNPGPGETLSLFRRSAYVCTDSFAGTALAILFHKPFFTALPPGELAAPDGSRTYALLRRLGLTDRIAGRGDGADLLDPIDWGLVEARLRKAREVSMRLLESALIGEPAEIFPVPEEVPKGPHLPVERDRCTGCTACACACPQDAVSMERDREGFAYPVIDSAKCVGCGLCVRICPVLEPRETRHLPAAFAAWNRDEEVRRDSTSGGVFSALADFILEGGGVVFGASLDGRQRLRHAACFSKGELWRFRGTKFLQSDLGLTFRLVRECLETRQVLFCGTPCQVAGLYAYLGGRPENLITCDLVCGGAPSPGLWEDMARSIEARQGKDLQAVRFCNKVTGWRDSHMTLVYDNGTVDSRPFLRTEYGRAAAEGLLFRPSCYQCLYTSMARPGDFTLGDFLGLRPDELPEEQEKGVNLLLVNTSHGSHVFDQLSLARRAFPAERAIAGNPPLAAPPVRPPERDALFAAYALEPFDAVRKRYFSRPPLPLRAAARLLPKGHGKEAPY